MAVVKRVLLWIAAIVCGLYEAACLISLFGESGSDFLLSAAIGAILLFFIIRALRKPMGEKNFMPKKVEVEPVLRYQEPNPLQPKPEAVQFSQEEPVVREKPEMQPQVIVREVYIREASPQEEPAQKKSWIENLPEPEYLRRQKRIAENKKNGVACCPKCGSTSLSVNKKGYSFVKGVLISPLGGTIGMNKLKVTCLNCGRTFKPGR